MTPDVPRAVMSKPDVPCTKCGELCQPITDLGTCRVCEDRAVDALIVVALRGRLELLIDADRRLAEFERREEVKT